jgi:hypothetical protein
MTLRCCLAVAPSAFRLEVLPRSAAETTHRISFETAVLALRVEFAAKLESPHQAAGGFQAIVGARPCALLLPREYSGESKVVSYRRCRHGGLAHGMTDLVEALGDIAGGVKAGDRCALMGVDDEAALLGCLRAKRDTRVPSG